MYMFEFEHKFTQNDLVYMWQNIPPQLSDTFEMAESSIEHDLLRGQLLNKNDFGEDIRWMVFKVKQKAVTNYFDKVLAENVNADKRFDFEFNYGRKDRTKNIPSYSYNWPYDFFSIIEFAKMESDIEFKKE